MTGIYTFGDARLLAGILNGAAAGGFDDVVVGLG
jgi:hypothetical protein